MIWILFEYHASRDRSYTAPTLRGIFSTKEKAIEAVRRELAECSHVGARFGVTAWDVDVYEKQYVYDLYEHKVS